MQRQRRLQRPKASSATALPLLDFFGFVLGQFWVNGKQIRFCGELSATVSLLGSPSHTAMGPQSVEGQAVDFPCRHSAVAPAGTAESALHESDGLQGLLRGSWTSCQGCFSKGSAW